MNAIVVVTCIALTVVLTFLMLIGGVHMCFAEFCIALLLLLLVVCVYFFIKIKKLK